MGCPNVSRYTHKTQRSVPHVSQFQAVSQNRNHGLGMWLISSTIRCSSECCMLSETHQTVVELLHCMLCSPLACSRASNKVAQGGPCCDDKMWCMVCRVYVRVKPLSAEEVAVGQSSVLQCQDGHRLQCTALGSTKVKLTGRLVLFTLAPLLWAAWCITRLLIH